MLPYQTRLGSVDITQWSLSLPSNPDFLRPFRSSGPSVRSPPSSSSQLFGSQVERFLPFSFLFLLVIVNFCSTFIGHC
uniref:Uncharacterized protein n=1 Tax=Brassica oleracea var. oleracea TaxID=109376 RepID=A0A0D2ZWX6_BRAOL